MREGAGGCGTKGAENRLTLSHGPDAIVTHAECGWLEAVLWPCSDCGSRHTWHWTLSSVPMWGARRRPAYPGMASFFVIQLTVPSMLILFDSYI